MSDSSNGRDLYVAIVQGDEPRVRELLADPETDVNHLYHGKYHSLHAACSMCRVEMAKLLLAQPNIDVNLLNDGTSAFTFACLKGTAELVGFLLADPRVDVSLVPTDAPLSSISPAPRGSWT